MTTIIDLPTELLSLIFIYHINKFNIRFKKDVLNRLMKVCKAFNLGAQTALVKDYFSIININLYQVNKDNILYNSMNMKIYKYPSEYDIVYQIGSYYSTAPHWINLIAVNNTINNNYNIILFNKYNNKLTIKSIIEDILIKIKLDDVNINGKKINDILNVDFNTIFNDKIHIVAFGYMLS